MIANTVRRTQTWIQSQTEMLSTVPVLSPLYLRWLLGRAKPDKTVRGRNQADRHTPIQVPPVLVPALATWVGYNGTMGPAGPPPTDEAKPFRDPRSSRSWIGIHVLSVPCNLDSFFDNCNLRVSRLGANHEKTKVGATVLL